MPGKSSSMFATDSKKLLKHTPSGSVIQSVHSAMCLPERMNVPMLS